MSLCDRGTCDEQILKTAKKKFFVRLVDFKCPIKHKTEDLSKSKDLSKTKHDIIKAHMLSS